MPEPETLDLLVIGSGEGGKYLAWHMARSGKRVAVVERKLIGGSCPNTSCLPSKNEIWSAKVADLVHHAAKFGSIAGAVSVDMKKVLARKREMVDGLIATHLDLYRKSGAELIMGTGRFVAPRTVEAALNAGGKRLLTAGRIVLNLGTHGSIPGVPGLEAAKPMTNVELLELDRLPDHLIVIGGGYVGLELAQAYRRFGSRVTILETNDRFAAREDQDVAAELEGLFRDEGIDVYLGASVSRVEGRSGEAVQLRMRRGRRRADDRGQRHPGRGRTGAEHARHWARHRGRRARPARLRYRQRPARDQRSRGLGARRMRRQPAVHPCFARRFSRRARQHGRRRSQHARAARSLLPVHRSAARPRRLERGRGAAERHSGSGGEAADDERAESAHALGDARLHEGADRSGRRPHSSALR